MLYRIAGTWHSSEENVDSVSATHLIPSPCEGAGKQHMAPQIAGTLIPLWEARIQFLPPRFCLAQPSLL